MENKRLNNIIQCNNLLNFLVRRKNKFFTSGIIYLGELYFSPRHAYICFGEGLFE